MPIVLHLLKREPEARVKFAAVKLIKQAPVEYTDRRRLRELLLLALRVTALLLLALAFARPFVASGAAVGTTGVTVVALDTSYSLAAPGRFERARQLAKDAVAKAPAGDLVGVVTFADQAEIATAPGSDRTLANDAIQQASPGFGATRYRAALSAASQHLAGRHGTVVVVTDLQENGWDAGDRASVPEGTTIQVVDVGAMPPNLAVTAVRVLADRVVATVHNASARARDARVHLAIDKRPAGDATVSLGANQSSEATFAGAPRGTAVAVTVDDPDGIQADNARYAVLGGTSRPTVLVVTGSGDVNRDAFYVQHALAAGRPADAAFRSRVSRPRSWRPGPRTGSRRMQPCSCSRPVGWSGAAANCSPRTRSTAAGSSSRRGPRWTAKSSATCSAPDRRCRSPHRMQGSRQSRVLAPADGRHPVFQAFAANPASLGLVTFRNAARVGGAACQTLARFTTGETALVECPAGEGRAIVHRVGPRQPLERFSAARDVRAVRARGRALSRELAPARARLSDRRRAGGRAARAGDRHARRNGARGGRRARDRRQRRPARIRSGAAVGRRFSIGGDAAEGCRRPRDARSRRGSRRIEQHLWQYALAAMAILLAAEGVLAARTA